MTHPREVLLGAQAGAVSLPVCDHYSGVEVRMRKSLQLQAEMQQEFGTCVFDVTLDCEDGAPVGGEAEHAQLVVELALAAAPEADADAVIKDAHGTVLQDGDSVVVIKDLKIKGSSSVVKVGTKVKNIRLADGDHDIDCKIDGIGAMGLKSEFVKKV